MKFLFVIQGEGRGHLTQALSLEQMIKKRGHTVLAALVGSPNGEAAQPFFTDSFGSEVLPFTSPSLVYSSKTKKLSLLKTFRRGVGKTIPFLRSIHFIHKVIKEKKPDVIINFYDTMCGMHQFFYREKTPMFCVAHQYLLLHKDFTQPKGFWLQGSIVNFITRVTALGAKKKLALSFYPTHADGNIEIIPPLLRKEVKDLKPSQKGYLLAYTTQSSMLEDIINWQAQNPTEVVHCFTDKNFENRENLFFHKINGPHFLAMMKDCKGLLSTAGFESICEAMYLNKPVHMIPMPNHYEQTCNALDAVNAGAGITGNDFRISKFLEFINDNASKSDDFQIWEKQCEELFFKNIYKVLKQDTYSSEVFSMPNTLPTMVRIQ